MMKRMLGFSAGPPAPRPGPRRGPRSRGRARRARPSLAGARLDGSSRLMVRSPVVAVVVIEGPAPASGVRARRLSQPLGVEGREDLGRQLVDERAILLGPPGRRTPTACQCSSAACASAKSSQTARNSGSRGAEPVGSPVHAPEIDPRRRRASSRVRPPTRGARYTASPGSLRRSAPGDKVRTCSYTPSRPRRRDRQRARRFPL